MILAVFLLYLINFGIMLHAGGMPWDSETGRELLLFFLFAAAVAGAVRAIRGLMDSLKRRWETRRRR